ncbi:unnamed protein product [Acanthoscelides obtectus]|uniref:Uncharacterized protein n=1 Tax=Acanthoscelides obtectus TaxID=200917 RepID=A0A9P0MAK6_ACAOB|nr:unnamed protein product [Acanthoscelides obtectus]CAK1623155.1 hypothetical protein AOBTE_LOCUS1839 [Acanthoscelides obtectus]
MHIWLGVVFWIAAINQYIVIFNLATLLQNFQIFKDSGSELLISLYWFKLVLTKILMKLLNNDNRLIY